MISHKERILIVHRHLKNTKALPKFLLYLLKTVTEATKKHQFTVYEETGAYLNIIFDIARSLANHVQADQKIEAKVYRILKQTLQESRVASLVLLKYISDRKDNIKLIQLITNSGILHEEIKDIVKHKIREETLIDKNDRNRQK